MKNILITGGAGFIGSNLSLKLISKGYNITVLDNLSPQIHGINPKSSQLYNNIKDKVTFIHGDVRDINDWKKAIIGQDSIIHLAAETGTGQSMYEIDKYVEVNINGTSLFLNYLANNNHCVEKVIVASSRAVYGEGKYLNDENNVVYPNGREVANLDKGIFEPIFDSKPLRVTKTDEDSPFKPQSVYGITKQLQEQLVLNVCSSLSIPAVALRFQNVYGPGQSLKNPYTGILSIFSTLILNNQPINIFEDGLESRDFVYIDDVVDSIILSLESNQTIAKSYNVGTGIATNVIEVANILQEHYNHNVPTIVSGNYRKGDIRHNIADISKIREELGFEPQFRFYNGIRQFTDWVKTQEIEKSQFEKSVQEMKAKGIMK
jgi:dTDP-L-rhamnose 4-epimerase